MIRTCLRPWPTLSLLSFCFFLLAAGPPNSTGAETAAPFTHRLEIRLAPEEHRLTGEDVLQTRTEGEAFSFDLHAGLQVTRFLLEETDLTGALKEKERTGHRVTYLVPVPEAARGREVDIRVVYAGPIYDPVRKSPDLTFVAGDLTSGLIGAEGIFLPADAAWYPQPAGARGQLATFSLRARIADPWRLISQGDRVSQEVNDGIVTAHFSSPIPTDGLSLVGGKYVTRSRTVDGVTLSTYFFAEEAPLSDLFLEKAAEYLRTFSDLLIPYPYKKFDIVENFFTSGYGMPTYTLLGRDVVKQGHLALRPGYLDHEIVHSWWGNYVYYEGAWGNWCEGLTTYYANYLTKERQDAEEARSHRKGSSQRYSIRVDREKDYPLRKFSGKEEGFEDDIGYGKASMVFHSLRRMAGDDRFFGAMRQMLRDYGGKVARWEDFQQTFEKALGRDLEWFFRQWLDRPGLPQLRLEGVSSQANGNRYRVTGQLRQQGTPYRLSVPLVLEAEGERQAIVVETEGEATPFAIEARNPPRKLSLDPDYHLIRRLAPQEIPPCLQATLKEKEKLLVYPSSGPRETVEVYQRVAERAAQTEGGTALPDDRVSEEALRSHSLLLLGGPGENRATHRVLERLRLNRPGQPKSAAPHKETGLPKESDLFTEKSSETEPAALVAGPSSFSLDGKEYSDPSHSLMASFRHPWNSEKFVTVYYGLSPQALERAQYIFFYGWDGFVAFQGGRPAQRGHFPLQAPETVHLFTEHHDVVPKGGSRHPGEELSLDALRVHVEYLASQELGGRHPGTPGAQKAAGYIARRMARIGLAPYRAAFAHQAEKPSPPSESEKDYFQPFRLQSTGLDKHLARFKARGRGTPAAALVDLVRQGIESNNVVGFLEGSDPDLKEEIVILGAHYDHLGHNEAGQIFPGAVDNASGVAVMLEIAAVLASQAPRPKRSLLFVAFGAEEWGLQGSRHFVEAFPGFLTETFPPRERVCLMINLDSLGSGKPDQFYLVGESHFPALRALAAKHGQPWGLEPGKSIDEHGFKEGSDHYPFFEKGLVAVDLFAADYRALHQVTDRPEAVNIAQLQRLGRMVLGMIRELTE